MPYAGGAGFNKRKRCLEGTREELLKEISDWIHNLEKDTRRIFWLHGPAGTGKSSIAHTIAHQFQQLERLGSCFCFDRSRMGERRHEKVFGTIAKDLANRDMSLRRQLSTVVHYNDALKNTTDIVQQWEELIMKPARVLSEAIVGPIVIILDALDESGDTDSRRDILHILGDTESHITDLPPNLRILLTSRHLPDIDAALNGGVHVRQKFMDTIPPELTKRDIFRYVSGQLSRVDFEIRSQEVFDSLVGSSGQIFEWARLACAYIRGDNNVGTWLKPRERFNAIITHKKTEHVPLLDGMYSFILETILPKEQPPSQRDLGLVRFKSVMAQILGTKEPLSLDSLMSMRCHFKDLAEIDIFTVAAPMAALLGGITDSSGAIRPLHTSFSDFLTDRDRSHEFFIDVNLIHNDLAFASLGVMVGALQFNVCDLPSAYLPNSEIHDLDDRIKKCIPPELAYSCQYWTEHVRQAPFSPALAAEIRGFFNNERFLFWFEVLSLLKLVNTCAGSLSSLIQWAMVCRMTFTLRLYSDLYYSLTESTGTSLMRQQMLRDLFGHSVVQFLQARLTCTYLHCHFHRRKHIFLSSLQRCSVVCQRWFLGTELRGQRSRVKYMGILGQLIRSRSRQTANTPHRHQAWVTTPSDCGMLRPGSYCDHRSADMRVRPSGLSHSRQTASALHLHQLTTPSSCGMLRRGRRCGRRSRDIRIGSRPSHSRQTASASRRHHVIRPFGYGMLRRGSCCDRRSRDMRVPSRLSHSRQTAGASFRHQARVTRPSGCGGAPATTVRGT